MNSIEYYCLLIIRIRLSTFVWCSWVLMLVFHFYIWMILFINIIFVRFHGFCVGFSQTNEIKKVNWPAPYYIVKLFCEVFIIMIFFFSFMLFIVQSTTKISYLKKIKLWYIIIAMLHQILFIAVWNDGRNQMLNCFIKNTN